MSRYARTPTLRTRIAKKTTDQIDRRLTIETCGRGGGRLAGLRGGATQGPVGEFWNESR